MRRSWRGSGIAIGLLALLAPAVPGDEPAAAPRSPLVARALERPPPDLAMLPRRVCQSAKGAFDDLIRLRETGDAEAVPVLVEILERERQSTRIFRFAAEQALFHIGGEEAEEALRKESAADDYPWWPAIDYTFHWDMDAGERDRFLARYVVRSSNAKLKARLTADRASAKPREDFTFTLTLANETSEPVAILTSDGMPTMRLVFRDAEGRFPRVQQAGIQCAIPKLGWRTVEPGKSTEFRFVRSFLPGKGVKGTWTYVGRPLGVETDGRRDGRFDVIAVVSGCRCEEAGEPPATPWVGRVVSEPLALTIAD